MIEGILLEQFGQRLPELDVVLALLGGDRHRQHRRIGNDLGHRRMRLLAVAQGVAGLGMVELAERHGVAGLGRTALLALLAHELEHRRDAPGVPLGGGEMDAVADLAAEHARTDILPPCELLMVLST